MMIGEARRLKSQRLEGRGVSHAPIRHLCHIPA